MKNLRMLLLVILAVGAIGLHAVDNEPMLTSQSPEVRTSKTILWQSEPD